MMPLLETIHSPVDVRKLNLEELSKLSDEIRELLVQVVARNGGHLSSNLGAVDLTLGQDHLGYRSPELHPQDHHRPARTDIFHP
jgi:1-deoxy-D-xylulose-5-phosphate synthase